MNRKRGLIIILILLAGLFPLIPIPIAKATEATVSIQESEDDVWMTESGNIFGYEASVRILEPEIGIRSFLRFGDVPLLKSSKINYATLYVYAGWDQGKTTSPGASVTIYGIDEPDCAPFSYSGRVWSLERPYTSAYVNWNVSYWPQSTWQAVNVTSIVKEIINQYAWEQNNSIGFQILGASDSGHEYRTFEDIDHQHHGAYAYLYFQYDTPPGTPPGLPDTAIWEETYGEWDIWSVPGEVGGPVSLQSYMFIEGTGAPFDVMFDNTDADGPFLISNTEALTNLPYTGRSLAVSSNGTLFAVYQRLVVADYAVFIKKSLDDGATWIDETQLSNYSGMSTRTQGKAVITIDSNDYLHICFSGKASIPYSTYTQVWYINYTDSWGAITRLNTYPGQTTNDNSNIAIASDSNNNLHVVWQSLADGYGFTQVWYTNFTTSWITPVRVSTYTDMNLSPQTFPDIEVDSNNMTQIIWIGIASGYTKTQLWYSNGTLPNPLRISDGLNMAGSTQYGEGSIDIDSNNYLHIIWRGQGTGATNQQIYYKNRTSSWSTPIIISTADGQGDYYQHDPTIVVGEGDDLHALWGGMATGYTTQEILWYSTRTTEWGTPSPVQPIGQNYFASLKLPATGLGTNETFYVVDENNTVIESWNGDNFTDIDDLKDWVDDYVDPGGGDPLDPTPGTQGFTEEGPFTRFKMRLYFLVIGLGCIFGPLWAMGYKKLDSVGYAWCALLMILGTGLLWSITGI